MGGTSRVSEHPIFVGRQAELAQLSTALDRALAGRGGLFLLRGEPGIGKTSLAVRVAAEAEERGAFACWGRATQAEGAPPHWPWLQILRSLAEELGPEAFSRLAGENLADILTVAPELRAMFAGASTEPGDEGARFRAYEAVASLIVRASDQRPFLLLLEDMHWADTPSLLLLLQLAGALGRSRVMAVCTYRDFGLGPEHPLKAWLADFVRGGESGEISLTGLGMADTGSLIRTVTAYEPAGDVVRRLHQRTAGNPFFLKELARTLRDEASPPLEQAVLPEGVSAVLRRRISGVSPRAQKVLDLASAAGDEFDVELLAAATASPRNEILDDCDEAARAGILVQRPHGYAFAHGLYRDTVSAGLGAAQRAALHAAIGRALTGFPRQGTPATLAYHFSEAAKADGGLRSIALDYSVRAGEQATAGLAYEEAARHFERALELADAALPELLLALGRARYLAGDPSGALAAAREASAIAEQRADGGLLARAALVVSGVGGPGLTPRVMALCDAAMRRPTADPSLRVQVLSQLTVALMQMVEPDAARRAAQTSDEAMRLGGGSRDPDTVFAALHARQMARSGPDGVLERLGIGEQALELAQRTGRLAFASWGHAWRSDALVQLGRMDEAEMALAEQGRAADQLREPLARWRYLVGASWMALLRGRFGEARRVADQALETVDARTHPIAEFNHLVHGIALADLTGARDDRRARMEAFATTYPEMAAPIRIFQIIDLVAEGRIVEARAALPPVTTVWVNDLRPLMAWLPAVGYAASAVAAVGDPEPAVALYEALLPYAGQVVTTGAGTASVFGSVAQHLARLATTLGRLDDAARHFEAAIEFEKTMGAPAFFVRSQVYYAELQARRGEEAAIRKALSLAGDGLKTARELGMAPWVKRASAVLDVARTRGVTPHPLSRRELEVAALVSQGLSNRAIADRLHLSERTAESHVKNICDKLGFNSRAQVAAWAATAGFSTEIQ
jgi:DNA-binding CsgD family transcriptional regulator/tetratricopeptide (TPR) repeat protein